jgi:hypothetical protein
MGLAVLSAGDKWIEARVLGWLPEAWVNFSVSL